MKQKKSAGASPAPATNPPASPKAKSSTPAAPAKQDNGVKGLLITLSLLISAIAMVWWFSLLGHSSSKTTAGNGQSSKSSGGFHLIEYHAAPPPPPPPPAIAPQMRVAKHGEWTPKVVIHKGFTADVDYPEATKLWVRINETDSVEVEGQNMWRLVNGARAGKYTGTTNEVRIMEFQAPPDQKNNIEVLAKMKQN